MTASLKNPPKYYSLSTQVAIIVTVGMLVTAALSFWTAVPLVNSLIDLAHDQRQVEMISDTRLNLGELYKLRKSTIESQIKSCLDANKIKTCTVSLDGESNIVTSVTQANDGIQEFQFEWLAEDHLKILSKKGSWNVFFSMHPIRPLGDEISKWLAAHEHLNLVIEKIQYSLFRTMGLSIAGGVLISLLIVSVLSRSTRRQFNQLRGYISGLAKGEGLTTSVPKILTGSGDLSLLANDVYNMSQSLDKAQKKALENDRMQVWQTMARKVAHEIKNPITPIGLVGEQLAVVASNLKDEKIKNNLIEASRIIGEETSSLNRMVREFTAFARLPKPQLELVKLSDLVSDFISRNSNQDQIKFECVFSKDNDLIMADPGMIRQVLHNLVNNSRLAKTPEEVTIKFEIKKLSRVCLEFPESRREELKKRSLLLVNEHFSTTINAESGSSEQTLGSELVLDVSDDGPGVPESLCKTMFDAYVTSRSTGEKEKGMGLGLTISRQILADHNGTLGLFSTSSKGTTMRIVIPMAPSRDERTLS